MDKELKTVKLFRDELDCLNSNFNKNYSKLYELRNSASLSDKSLTIIEEINRLLFKISYMSEILEEDVLNKYKLKLN